MHLHRSKPSMLAHQHYGWHLSPLCAKAYRQVLLISKAVSSMRPLKSACNRGKYSNNQGRQGLGEGRQPNASIKMLCELLSPNLALLFVK